MHKLKTFLSLPSSEKMMVFQIFIGLGIAKVVIRALPFRCTSRWFGVQAGVHGKALAVEMGEPTGRLEALHRLILIVSRYTPWRSVCYPQALVALWFLKRWGYRYDIYFGTGRSENGTFVAHTWVVSDSQMVTGGNGFLDYAVVAHYKKDTGREL
ncbi:MAG: lasso peptide biosynthesis B2 protein [Bacilli bacterium]